MRPTSSLLVSIALLGACHPDASTGTPPPPKSSSALAAQLQTLAQRMHARYGGALRLEQAIALSDLERAHAEAHAVSILDEPNVLPEWRPYFETVSEAARQVELSSTEEAAARQFATLGLRCAHCHEATAAKITLPSPPLPIVGASRMAAHQQAALEMWEGLMAPSDEHWLAGAQALTTVPLTLMAQAVTPTSDQDVDDVARVRLYARRALTVGDKDLRAETFGALLATCAHCHAVLRDR